MIPNPDPRLDEAARVIAEIPAAVALFDADLRYVAASALWVEAFGLEGAALSGQRHDEFGAVGRAALAQAQRRALAAESVDDCPIAANDAWQPALLAARPHHDLDGAIAGVVLALRRADRPAVAIPSGALPDALGSLADRDQFVRRLGQALTDAEPTRRNVLVIAINLDNSRAIKNLYGAGTVDLVVKIIGERLVSGTRAQAVAEEGALWRGGDLVAPLETGQFVVLCGPPVPAQAAAQAFADRLLRLVEGPVAVDGQMLHPKASAGFVQTTASHGDAHEVLRDVDVALQRAQTLGPGKAVAWEPALTRAATWRYTLAEELRRGFDNGEFTLHYQPVLRLRDNRMVGAEVLLRWNHPREGLAPSATFVPVLEETGLIVDVGSWVVREAVRQLESWRLLYGRDVVDWLSINLSARQLGDPSALLATLRAIHDGSFPVHRLMLEASEAAWTCEPPAAAPALVGELRELGVRCAIDDFGAASGSLASLGAYPIDTVKIDARLVGQIGTVRGDRMIETLLGLAGMHGVAVIAKGVETAAQRDFLQGAGCGFGQGHRFAEPMDGALLGAYALTHAVSPDAIRPRRIAGG